MTIASILFAAGRGSRLQPLTDTIPKPALPLLDVPLGAFGLVPLARVAPPVAVNVSHLGAEVIAALKPFASFEVLDEGSQPFGSAGTVAALLGDLDEHFVTHNCDVVTDVEVGALLDDHRESGAAGTIVVRPVVTGADLAVEGERITGFIDRRANPNADGFQFLGIAAFTREAIAALRIEAPAGLGETILRPLAEAGALRARVHHGYWADVGTFDAYLAASIDALWSRAPQPPRTPPGLTLEVDGGRAYVGAAADVAPQTLGPDAIVLAGATVMEGAHVERSVVLPGRTVGAAQAVVDSVLF